MNIFVLSVFTGVVAGGAGKQLPYSSRSIKLNQLRVHLLAYIFWLC